jgi:hypothetical protein
MLEFIGKWKDKVTDYIDVRVQLVKLEIVERTSHILSYIMYAIIITLFMAPVLLFTGMGLAELFAEIFDSRVGGYFLVAGVYLLILLILYANRKSIIAKFIGLFISVMTHDEEEGKDAQNNRNT